MKLTLLQHAGNPNMCRIPELAIRSMPECEGGGWYLPKAQAEFLVHAAEGLEDTTIDEASPLPTWIELVTYWKVRAETAEATAPLPQHGETP